MGSHKTNTEIEVRFLEINKEKLVEKLKKLGAKDLGERLLSEIIFYDKQSTYKKTHEMVRVRKDGEKIQLAYKHHKVASVDGTTEIEIDVSDEIQTRLLLEAIGLVAYRFQEKRRHTFRLNNVTVDVDTWPQIPTYVEIEGESEDDLKVAASILELDWKNAIFESARAVIEKYYRVPVSDLHYFTFDKIE